MKHEVDLGYISPINLGSAANSSHYSRTIPIGDPWEGALAQKVDEMGHQLEALKVKSDRPYEKEFNMAPPFTLKIITTRKMIITDGQIPSLIILATAHRRQLSDA